jgi:hypothetical protein
MKNDGKLHIGMALLLLVYKLVWVHIIYQSMARADNYPGVLIAPHKYPIYPHCLYTNTSRIIYYAAILQCIL